MCSSDLNVSVCFPDLTPEDDIGVLIKNAHDIKIWTHGAPEVIEYLANKRSEERRVGKEGRSRWSP